jgi:hypothetical protein
MRNWDDWVQCEEDSEMLIYEEYMAFMEEHGGESHLKIEDRCCGDSQRQLPLTDTPF